MMEERVTSLARRLTWIMALSAAALALPGLARGFGLQVSQDGNKAIIIRTGQASPSLKEIKINGESYYDVRLAGLGKSGEIGGPDLPFKSVLLEIPYGVAPRGRVTAEKWTDLGPGYKVLPRQPAMIDQPGERPEFTIDERAYELDELVRPQPFSVSSPSFMRGRRVIEVEVYPIGYVPSSGRLFAAEELEITIELEGDVDPGGEIKKARLFSESFNRLGERTIANYQDANKDVKDLSRGWKSATSIRVDGEGEISGGSDDPGLDFSGLDGGGPGEENGADYLIIAHDSYLDCVEPLAEWTTLKGYVTRVAAMSEIGTTADEVEDYIRDAYETWTPAPSYLLLVGDYNQTPSQVVSPSYTGTGSFISDLPYSCMDAGYFPDINAGRIPVLTAAQCSIVVNKILKYDRRPDMGSWYDDALIATYMEDENLNCGADRWFLETAAHVKDFLDGDTAGMTTHPAFTSTHNVDGLSCDPATYLYLGYPHRPDHPDEIPAEIVSLISSYSTSAAEVITQFNAGVGLAFHRGHGAARYWDQPRLSTSNTSSLTNGDMTPVVFSINCETGMFDYYANCLAEALLQKSGGGAVAVIAADRVSYSGYNDLLTHGLFTSMWPEYDLSHGETAYPGGFRPVEAMNFAKYYLRTYEGLDDEALYTFRIYHYFGDPLMYMRTTTPFSMTVSHASTVDFGSQSLKVYGDREGARAAAVQDGVVLGVGIIQADSVTVTFSPIIRPDPVNVTVTAHDAYPYEGQAAVALPSDGIVFWSDDVYGWTQNAGLSLADADLEGSDTVTIELWSSSYPTPVAFDLGEDPPDSGFFSGLPALGVDLLVDDGDTITALYVDADTGDGDTFLPKTDEALVDGAPPVFSGLAQALPSDTVILLDWAPAADDNGPITYNVYRAETSGGQNFLEPLASAGDTAFVDYTAVFCTRYYYVVRAEDRFGQEEGNTVELSTLPHLAGRECTLDAVGNYDSYLHGTVARGNVYTVSQTVELTSVDIRLRENGSLWFFVYENDSVTGEYELIHSNQAPYQGYFPNHSWFNSGDISVTLKKGKRYYIGFAANHWARYYFGGTVPYAETFGVTETGVPENLVSYPPGSTVTINYTSGDSAPFTQRLNVCTGMNRNGYVEWDNFYYGDASEAGLYVEDYDLICTDSLTVDVWSASDPTPIPLSMTEDPAGSGKFLGSLIVGEDLQVANGDTITAMYVDADTGAGDTNAAKHDRAIIDLEPPSFGGIESALPGLNKTFLAWSAASDVNAPITYNVYRAETRGGQDFGDPHAASGQLEMTDTSLTNGQAYFYVVRAMDRFGNEDGNTAQRAAIPSDRQVAYGFYFDSDPGWSVEGQWEFGVPTGQGTGGNGDPTSGYTGDNVYGYNLDGDYPNSMAAVCNLTTGSMDLSNYTSVLLRFQRWMGIDNGAYDGANVRVSSDMSSWSWSWTNPHYVLIDTAWTQADLDIAYYADRKSTVWLRWTMGPTNATDNYFGWNIDDVEVWGVSLSADSDADGVPDETETGIGSNPYHPDSDADGLSDGEEYNSLGTDPTSWDTDGDALPDAFEAANMTGHSQNLDPLDPDDGMGADFDGDGAPNSHEYYNGTGIWTESLAGGTGCLCWADSGDTISADGMISPLDLIALKSRIDLKPASYTGVIPPNGDSQELDMDEIISPLDANVLKQMIAIQGTLSNPSIPVTLELSGDGLRMVEVGSTTRITVGVKNDYPNYTAGIGVIFSIGVGSAGSATLLGGEGSAGVQARYDVSGPIAEGGRSSVVVRVDAAGTIIIDALAPQCGSGGKGRYMDAINAAGVVTIIGVE